MDNIYKCFEILNVPPDAPYDEAKAAYRELASILHPDKHMHNERIKNRATEKFKQLQSAWDELDKYYKCLDQAQKEELKKRQADSAPRKNHSTESRTAAGKKAEADREAGAKRKKDAEDRRFYESLTKPYCCMTCGTVNQIRFNSDPELLLCGNCGNPLGAKRLKDHLRELDVITRRSKANSERVAKSRKEGRVYICVEIIIFLLIVFLNVFGDFSLFVVLISAPVTIFFTFLFKICTV